MSEVNPQERIGTREREAALTALSGHLSAGRLDQAEFEARRERAGSAVTRGDLDAIFNDLPTTWERDPATSADSPSPVIQPYQPPAGAEARPMDRQMMHQPTARKPPQPVERALAISGGLATVVFLIIGFALDGWAWGWIVFLIPGLVRGYYGIQGRGGSC